MDQVYAGIDPGTQYVGIAGFIVRPGSNEKDYPTLVYRGRIKAPKLPLIERLDEISFRLNGILAQIACHGPISRVFIENSIVGHSVKASLKVAWSTGYVLKTCCPYPRTLIENTEVKKRIAGSGCAKKEDVRWAVCELFNIDPETISYDEADAVAVGLCGILLGARNVEITDQDYLTLLTRKEAADWAKVSTWTIDEWRKKGMLEGHQPVDKGAVRFTLAALKKCLSARSQPNR